MRSVATGAGPPTRTEQSALSPKPSSSAERGGGRSKQVLRRCAQLINHSAGRGGYVGPDNND
jgi:hypothetical protein